MGPAADFFVTLISSATVSAALVGLLLSLTKTWIGERLKNAIKAEYDSKLESLKAQLKTEYDKELETHKAQLKAQADVELEKLRSSLAEQNATFVRLHDRRIEVIDGTYARLTNLYVAAFSMSRLTDSLASPPLRKGDVM